MSDVQRFLGLPCYYRRFNRDFASITKPLHRLTEQGRRFHWMKECDDAFGSLKAHLTSAPILGFPDCTKPFILDTYASEMGLGAVLSQEIDGKNK